MEDMQLVYIVDIYNLTKTFPSKVEFVETLAFSTNEKAAAYLELLGYTSKIGPLFRSIELDSIARLNSVELNRSINIKEDK